MSEEDIKNRKPLGAQGQNSGSVQESNFSDAPKQGSTITQRRPGRRTVSTGNETPAPQELSTDMLPQKKPAPELSQRRQPAPAKNLQKRDMPPAAPRPEPTVAQRPQESAPKAKERSPVKSEVSTDTIISERPPVQSHPVNAQPVVKERQRQQVSPTVVNKIIKEHKVAVRNEVPRVQPKVPLKMQLLAEEANKRKGKYTGRVNSPTVHHKTSAPASEYSQNAGQPAAHRETPNDYAAPNRAERPVQQRSVRPQSTDNAGYYPPPTADFDGVQTRPYEPPATFLYTKLTPGYNHDVLPDNRIFVDPPLKFRHELKYYLPMADYMLVRSSIKSLLRPDEHADERTGRYTIRSLYFDDYEDSALTQKLAGYPDRAKYRIRIYDYSDRVIRFEKKIKHGQYIAKKSIRLTREECDRIISGDFAGLLLRPEPLAKEIYYQMASNGLTPRRVVDYEREAYVMPYENIRVTFDLNLKAGRMLGSIFDEHMPTMSMLEQGKAVLEVKFDRALPTYIRNVLGNMKNEQRSSVSKYVICRMYD